MEVDVGSVISGLSGGDGAGLGPGEEEEELEVGGAPGCSGAGSLQFDFERSRSESSVEEEEELEEEDLEGAPGACREEEGLEEEDLEGAPGACREEEEEGLEEEDLEGAPGACREEEEEGLEEEDLEGAPGACREEEEEALEEEDLEGAPGACRDEEEEEALELEEEDLEGALGACFGVCREEEEEEALELEEEDLEGALGACFGACREEEEEEEEELMELDEGELIGGPGACREEVELDEEVPAGGSGACFGACREEEGELQLLELDEEELTGAFAACREEEGELELLELESGPGARFGTCREEEGELDSDAEREGTSKGLAGSDRSPNALPVDSGTPPPREAEAESTGEQQRSTRLSPHSQRTINLSELTPYIVCSICNGYFIDATTITECLHTFCKSCIVRHFYYSNRCPKCNIVVHQTQPLYNIRLDRQLQDIVYKVVVNLEEKEKKQMHDFYKERGLEVPKPTVPQPVPVSRGRPRKVLGSAFRIPPELDFSLRLEFIGANEGAGNFKPLKKKFVRVSGDATIGHVEKFLRRKMELDPACRVDIICGDHLLEPHQTLREIRQAIGDAGMQDGLLVLHYGLVVAPLTET